MNTINVFKSSIVAGIAIGIAGIGFLATTNIIGSVLFAFALLTVVAYKLSLYTGTAGFINKNEINKLILILFGNIIGCFLMALMARLSPLPLQESAQILLNNRLNMGYVNGGILSIACGFIMTTAVTFARKGNNLPLLFGIPLFITCGYPHSIADAFFYLCAPVNYLLTNFINIIIFYISIVIGNFLGCNLYRMFFKTNP